MIPLIAALGTLSFMLPPVAHAGGMTREQVAAMMVTHAGAGTVERIEAFSAGFIGAPYVADGLGEGSSGHYDQDPLERFDQFDCTTFVETVTALAISSDLRTFGETLQKIRYRNGNVTYTERNHFPELDWIPNNVSAGFYEDITAEVAARAGLKTKIATAIVDKRTWYEGKESANLSVSGLTRAQKAKRLEDWRREGQSFDKELAFLDYISLSNLRARKALRTIPSGAVINVVRPHWDLRGSDGALITQLIVSHQAFVIRKNGVLHVRHASSTTAAVSEMPLRDYVKRYLEHPTIKGFNILRVRTK